jgi:hypothetical protein
MCLQNNVSRYFKIHFNLSGMIFFFKLTVCLSYGIKTLGSHLITPNSEKKSDHLSSGQNENVDSLLMQYFDE